MAAFALMLLSILFVNMVSVSSKKDKPFSWDTREEVQEWFDDVFTANLADMFTGQLTTAQFADNVKMADDWEDYFCGGVTKGRSVWEAGTTGIWNGITSFEGYYYVTSFTSHSSLSSYTLIWELSDGSKWVSRGTHIGVWTDEGEMTRWVYFEEDNSLCDAMGRLGEILAGG
eukprot:144909_1